MIQPTTDQLADIGREVLKAYDVSPQWWHDNLAMIVVWKIEEYRKPTHFATLGIGHRDAGCFILLHADSHAEAHAQMMFARSTEWAFIYPIEDLESDIAKGWLDGGEVPL